MSGSEYVVCLGPQWAWLKVKSIGHRKDSGWGGGCALTIPEGQRVTVRGHRDGPPRVAQEAKVSPESLSPRGGTLRASEGHRRRTARAWAGAPAPSKGVAHLIPEAGPSLLPSLRDLWQKCESSSALEQSWQSLPVPWHSAKGIIPIGYSSHLP